MREFDAIIIGAEAGPSLAGRLTGAGMTVAFVDTALMQERTTHVVGLANRLLALLSVFRRARLSQE